MWKIALEISFAPVLAYSNLDLRVFGFVCHGLDTQSMGWRRGNLDRSAYLSFAWSSSVVE